MGVFDGARGQTITAVTGKNKKRVRIRFGELVHGPGRMEEPGEGEVERTNSSGSAKGDYVGVVGGEGSTARHIGFGAVENVVAMRKGGRYV